MSDGIDRLRALLAEATPGPWREESPGSYGWIVGPDGRGDEGTYPEGGPGDVVRGATPCDAALIVALRNLAPELLALLDAATADMSRGDGGASDWINDVRDAAEAVDAKLAAEDER